MSEYVYGIVGADVEPPARPGIRGAPLRVIEDGDVAALVSELPAGELRLGREELMAHSQVLTEALAQGTVLPMRFGIVLEDPDAVRRRLLDAHTENLRTQLDRFVGRVEMSVRGIYDERPVMREIVAENPQIARLRESLRGQSEDASYFARIQLGELVADALAAKRRRDADAILAALNPLSDDVRISEPAHERAVLTASFLLERRRLKKFDDALEAVAAQQAGRIRFKLTGPLPPHSFVELQRED